VFRVGGSWNALHDVYQRGQTPRFLELPVTTQLFLNREQVYCVVALVQREHHPVQNLMGRVIEILWLENLHHLL
jgi:hypothetical protein